jgi:N6-adenosine-specific RNA methylase IME4
MNKKYKTILADPPWKLTSMSSIAYKCNKPLENKYNTMSLNELKSLPINELKDNDCSLFLWCTHSTLPDALELMANWGFKYHCVITWDKLGGFSLWGFHRRTELLLFGYYGKININQKGKYIPTIFTERKTKHSKKPKIMYQWLNSNTPEPRLELFAREKTKGWDVWGNEVESDIKL